MNIVLPLRCPSDTQAGQAIGRLSRIDYVRVGRAAVPDVYENDDFDFVLEANMLLDGTDLTIIVAEKRVYHAYQAGLMLQEKGIKACVGYVFHKSLLM